MLRKRIYAVVSALSLVTAALAPLASINVQAVYAAETSVIDKTPPTPSITRYSTSGWDATWFRMETNLQAGTCIYTIDPDPTKKEVTNYDPTDYEITELPEQFVGCDYILNRVNAQPTRNHHFYAEQDIVIYAAIDEKQTTVPNSLKGYTKTEGTLKIKDGTKYWLAKKEYYAGQVILDKYEGAGKNVFYMVLPKEGKSVSQALTHNAVVPEGNKPATNAADEKYKYYLNSVYNMETGKGVPAGYTGDKVSVSEPLGAATENKNYTAGDNIALDKPFSGNNKTNESPVDGDDQTYYQGEKFPSELVVDLRAQCKINKFVMSVRNKNTWADRTQKIEIQTSSDGTTYKSAVAAKDYTFKYNEGVEVTVPETTARYIKLVGTTNSEADGMQIAELEVYGPAQTVALVKGEADLDRYPIIQGGGNLTKTFDTAITGKIIYEGKVMASATNQKMSIPVMKSSDGKTVLDLTFAADGKIKAGNTEVVAYEAKKWHTIKLIIDTNAKSYDVYVDHMRKAQNIKFSDISAANIKSITWTPAVGTTLSVDNVRLYDDPEIYVIKDNFNAEATGTAQPANWTVSDKTKSAIQNVPFATDKSLQIQNNGAKVKATRNFGKLTGDVTIEAKVKPMENTWVTVPVVYDSKGEVVLKVAAYRNSFFISNGNNWEYLCSQETKHNYYPAANWYTVKIVLNTFSNRYDFYIDGAKRFTQASFVTDVDDVASMDFVAEEENVLYIDNVKVYDSASLARGLYPKDKVFNVKDYGAKGDGKTDDTAAVEAAMKAAAYTGGTVLLENGTFYCGQITMQSDMTLFIDESATIFFRMSRNDYIHFQPKYKGIVGYNGNHQLGAGLIRSVEGNHNFRINGGGTLDGNGFYGFNENDPDNERPCALYLTSSDDFSVENINIINSPHWTFVPYESTRMTIRNIGITNHIAPNRDGIDPVNCSNMTIENCYIFAGDDALCPKSGNAFPSINCDARNITMQSYCNGIKFGTDSYDDFKNYTFEDILIKNVGLSAISLQAVDGSEIENINFKRIDMMDVDNSIAFMVGDRKRANDGLDKHLGHIKGVTIEDMNYTNPMTPPFSHQNEDEHANMFVALNPSRHKDGNDAHIISDVTLKNVYMEMPGGYTEVPAASEGINGGYPEHGGMGNPTGWANTIRWAKNITFDNCQSVLLTEDVRTEYDYRDYYGGENIDTGVNGKVKYGIVFEDNGKVLKTPVLSGVIAHGQNATVLNYSLIHALEAENDFILDKAKYEGAIIKCDAQGNLTLTNAAGATVLAEAKMEKFSNEDGQRLVFHVIGDIDEVAASKRALRTALVEATDYIGQDSMYTQSSWNAFTVANENAKKATDSTSVEERNTLAAKLATAIDSLSRPFGTWIEAESGELGGGAQTAGAVACSGGSRVGNLGGGNSGSVSFKVSADVAASYKVSVQYCQAAARQLNVKVNGTTNSVNCGNTGDWNTPSTAPAEVTVELKKGVNKITLTGVGTADAPNVDRFMMEKIPGTEKPDEPETPAEPTVITINTTVEAESGLLENGAKAVDAAACSGGKYVGSLGEASGGTASFTVKADKAGDYDVMITYCSEMLRRLNVKVNGIDHAVTCPIGTKWNTPSEALVRATVKLNAGDNTLVLTGVGTEAAPNVDCLKVEVAGTTPETPTTPILPTTIAIGKKVEAEVAEKTALYGEASVAEAADCSNGFYVGRLGGSQNSTVSYNAKVTEAGTYKLSFVYATQEERQMNVQVNGTDHAASCPATTTENSWTVPSTEPITVEIELKEGDNTIVFGGVKGAYAPNLDWLMIEKVGGEAGSSEPSEPTGESKPSEPSEPSEPTEPSEPSEPTGESEPSGPSEPSEPSEPTEPSDVTVPSEPTVPSTPSESSEPTVPSEPTAPSTPTVPSQPTAPASVVPVLTEQEKKMATMFGVTPEAAKEIAAIVTQYKVSDATLKINEASIQAIKNDKDVAGSSFAAIQARAAKQTSKSVKLIWGKVAGADGYVILGNRCGKKNSYRSIATMAGGKTTYTDKALDKGTYYKYIVYAYKNVGGKQVTLAVSKTIHTVTKGGKYGVAKSVTVKPTNVKLKVGKTKKLSVKEVKADKKSKSHRKIAYETSDPAVATVTKNGKIKATGKGSCYVYVYAQNGVFKRVEVTVK